MGFGTVCRSTSRVRRRRFPASSAVLRPKTPPPTTMRSKLRPVMAGSVRGGYFTAPAPASEHSWSWSPVPPPQPIPPITMSPRMMGLPPSVGSTCPEHGLPTAKPSLWRHCGELLVDRLNAGGIAWRARSRREEACSVAAGSEHAPYLLVDH